mgnify:CR=1 FL=1
MKATLTNHLQSPRKTRLVTDLVKGKSVDEALELLKYTKRKSAPQIAKLIASATANAKQEGKEEKDLVIANITVDKGMTLKRYRPRWRGMVSPLRRERSHVVVTLSEKAPSTAK